MCQAFGQRSFRAIIKLKNSLLMVFVPLLLCFIVIYVFKYYENKGYLNTYIKSIFFFIMYLPLYSVFIIFSFFLLIFFFHD